MFSSLPYGYLSLYTLLSGTLFSISSVHWFGVWAGLEMNLIGFLPMLVYQKGTAASESAVKYFIAQAMGSTILIAGSLISSFYTWGLGLMVLSLVLKMGGFPFHYWLPAVMGGLDWFPCMILATWQKIAPLFLIFTFMSDVYYTNFLVILCVVAALSSVVGGVGGINQTQVRSMLAYSSISHMGWMLFSLLLSYEVLKFYFAVYVFINLCIFLGLWTINSAKFMDSSKIFQDKFCTSLILFKLVSLAGLPPLLGFIPKWSVIVCSMDSSFWGTNFFLIMGSLLGIFFYLNMFMFGMLSMGGDSPRGLLKPALVAGASVNLLGGLVLISAHNLLW